MTLLVLVINDHQQTAQCPGLKSAFPTTVNLFPQFLPNLVGLGTLLPQTHSTFTEHLLRA